MGLEADHPIAPGGKHERGHVDRTGIGQKAGAGIMQINQNVDRDLPKNQRVGVIERSLRRIVREHLCFHVALHVTGSDEFLFQPQRRDRERDVKPNAKRRSGENHGADRRRVIVDPGRDGDRADAVCQHDHVFQRVAVMIADVAHKRVHVFHHRAEVFSGAALAGRTSVPAGIPGEDRDVFQAEHLDDFRPAARMFVAAVKQKKCFRGRLRRDPGAIKQLRAIPGRKCGFERVHITIVGRALRLPPKTATGAVALPFPQRLPCCWANCSTAARSSAAMVALAVFSGNTDA